MELFTEYERLNRALSIYRDVMRRHIKDVLDDGDPNIDSAADWYERKVVKHLTPEQQSNARLDRERHENGSDMWRGENQLDIQHFLFAVKANPRFRKLQDQSNLDLMHSIYDTRNSWAHPPIGGFRKAEVDRTIKMCAQVLDVFDESAATELRDLNSLGDSEFEAGSAENLNETLRTIKDDIQFIREKTIDPNAINDLVLGTNDRDLIEQLRKQLATFAETLEQTLQKQSSQAEYERGFLLGRLDRLATDIRETRRNWLILDRIIDFAIGPGTAERLFRSKRKSNGKR